MTPGLLTLLYDHHESHDLKNHLHRLLQPENKDLLSQFLATHDLLDVFTDFALPGIPIQEICSQFGPMLPRFYSVASSPVFSKGQVDLTVALFSFEHKGMQRYGVGSHFLCHLAEIDQTPIPIYVQSAHAFSLPSNPHTPIIMVGPGTGVAPFSSIFARENSARCARKKLAHLWREKSKDRLLLPRFF